MKKNIVRILVIVMVIISVIIIFKPFEHFRLIDRYIRYNISSELSMLGLVIDELDDKLLIDEAYKTLDIEEMHKVVQDARLRVFLIDKSIGKLDLLNKKYDFNLYGLCDYLDTLESTLNENNRPSDAEMNVLSSVVEIMRRQSNSRVLQYYEDDKTGFTRLEVPEKTKLLFEELNNIEIVE